MNAVQIVGLCLMGMALIYAWLEFFVGSGRAKFTDLTRSGFAVDQEWHPVVDPLTRTRRNDLTVQHYLAVSERGGHRARPVRVKPEPVQLHCWEDDGGATA